MTRGSHLLARLLRARVLYLLLAPALLYFFLFAYFPILDGIRMSLQDFRLVGESRYVGAANYVEAFRTPGFWRVLGNTLILGAGNVTLTAFVPMLLALLLNEIGVAPWKRFVQTVLYLPHLFSWVIVGGMWIFMLSPNVGIVNVLRASLGLEPVYFMTREAYARAIMIGVNLWKQAGFVCILYLAAIAAVDPELYLAAMMDGAGAWKRALHVTLPQLVNTLRVVLLLNVMGALRMFDQIWVMRNPVIAPKVDVLMYYVYERGLVQFKIGYATAISVLVFVFTLVLTVTSNRFIKYAA